MRYLFCFFLLACQGGVVSFTKASDDARFRIVSYNVENLFDTLDTEFTNDEDFTPQGSYRWTPYRYWKKIKDIGKVLVSTSSYSVPGVIALVEVENYEVLEDILTNSPLRKFQYAIVHEDSPDERGIDVALLFDTDQFSYNSHEVIEVEFPFDKDDKTRDMLVVNGAIADDCYTIVVCHWPSRRGGQAISEGKRIHAAKELEQYLIREYREECRLLVLGDFNDDNQSASIQYLIQTEFDLRDAFLQIEMQGNGSYKYQNQWNMLDHIFISEEVNLLNAELFSPDFLQTEDVNYPGNRPFRTYLGPVYQGGYSDHYPLLIDIGLSTNSSTKQSDDHDK